MSESTSTPMWPSQHYSPISWGPEDRALILGAFFYGYVVFQVAAVDEKALTKLRCLGVEWPRCTERRRCLDTGLAQNMWMDIFVSQETQLCNHRQTDYQHVDDKLAGPPHPPGRLHQHLGHLCPPGCPGRHCPCSCCPVEYEVMLVISRVCLKGSPILRWTRTSLDGLPFKSALGDCSLSTMTALL